MSFRTVGMKKIVLAAIVGSIAAPAFGHQTPPTLVERSFAALRIYSDCVRSHTIRLGGNTADDAATVVRAARYNCTEEYRSMDEARRAYLASAGLREEGPDPEVMTSVEDGAIAALMEHRSRQSGRRRH
jgi:hypothetical protein